MTCYHPIKAYYAKQLNPTGKRSIVFNVREAIDDRSVTLSCGNCISCRLERSRQWAIRCMHEAKMHQENCFLTLTYDENNLRSDQSLHKEDFQKFFKRLRKQLYPQSPRYYMCGEYGETTNRPHFHACVFGYRPHDLTIYKTNASGHVLYNSKSLQKIWTAGHAVIGELTFESAAYVARYVLKKVNGKQAEQHYQHMNAYGEIIQKLPEYNQASLKPAIGKTWLDKYGQYIQEHDFLVVNGRKVKPPKYYDKKLHELQPILTETRKEQRQLNANKKDISPDRLAIKELCHEDRVKQLKRKFT